MALTETSYLSGKLSFSISDVSYLLRMVKKGDIRNSDGTNNASNEANLTNQPTTNGSEFSQFIRLSGATSYDDGIGSPNLIGSNGGALPNERVISNTVSASTPPDLNMPQVGGWNNLLMSVGQYIDHGLDFINKGGNGTYVIPDVPGDGPVGEMKSTRATPAPGTGTSTANPVTYNNTDTPWVDQNQTYGSDIVITNLLRLTLRDGAGNVVRDTAGNLVKTQYMLGGAVSADGKPGVPTYYDVLLNNGVDKVALDAILNSAEVQLAHAHYTTAYANFNSQGPAAFSVITQADIDAMTAAKAAMQALPGYVTDGAVPGANGQILLGDANPQTQAIPGLLATGDVVSLTQHYIAGDLRANENVGLTAFHEVFKNSHNVIADQISAVINAANTDAIAENDLAGVTTEDIFQAARIVMGAQYQRMVFDQFLIAMVGGIPNGVVGAGVFPPGVLPGPIPPAEHGFLGWIPEVNASISQEFSTAAYRVGHTQIYQNLGTLDASRLTGEAFDGSAQQITVALTDDLANVKQASSIVADSLVNLFLNPAGLDIMGGAAAVLAGNARESAQQVDTILTDAVRNMLVGRPQDLGAFNIARGREMGTVSLNEFRRATYNFFLATGVASSLGNAASDRSAGIFDPLSLTPNVNLILDTLRPYQNWADFGRNLRDWKPSVNASGGTLAFDLTNSATWGTSVLRDSFMALYGQAVGKVPTLLADGRAQLDNNIQAKLDNDWGLDNVDLWIGGLAEQAVLNPTAEGLLPSLMGSTFTFIIQEQFDRLQDGDRHYYKIDLAGTGLLAQISAITFTDMLRSSLGAGAQYIHTNTFQKFTLNDLDATVTNFTGDTDPLLTDDLIIGNAKDNILDGVLGSDDIRGGAGNDTIDGGDGVDHLYGQGGNDTIRGGNDVFVDFIFGGDGDDFLDGSGITAPPVVPGVIAVLPAGDQMNGENGNDTIIGSDFGNILDGGTGADTITGGAVVDLIVGDSGQEDAANPYGADRLDGMDGADLITGGGGGDTIFGGIGGDFLHGDWAPTANAEILARAIRTNGVITGTIIPLNFEIGATIVVDEMNPLTGVAFTEAELTEFKTYIEGLRVNPTGTVGGPTGRGAQPLMKVVPYVGPQGDDIIEGDNEVTDTANVGGVDTIFGDAGNDIIRPGALSDTVFGGRGFDTLDYTLQRNTDGNRNTDTFTIEITNTQAAALGDTQVQVDGRVINETALDENPDPVTVIDPETGIATIIPAGDTDDFYGMEAINLRLNNRPSTSDTIRRTGNVDSTVLITGNTVGNYDGLNFSGVERVNGDLGMDTVIFTAGNDTVSSRNNNLTYNGMTFSNFEVIVGAGGNDSLTGSGNADRLVGAGNGTNGVGTVDTLTGRGGADTFVLGEAGVTFYDDGVATANFGRADYARITDFATGDRIQLVGTASNYTLVNNTRVGTGRNSQTGLGLYRNYDGRNALGGNDDLIALIQGTTNNLTLNSNRFVFVA